MFFNIILISALILKVAITSLLLLSLTYTIGNLALYNSIGILFSINYTFAIL